MRGLFIFFLGVTVIASKAKSEEAQGAGSEMGQTEAAAGDAENKDGEAKEAQGTSDAQEKNEEAQRARRRAEKQATVWIPQTLSDGVVTPNRR